MARDKTIAIRERKDGVTMARRERKREENEINKVIYTTYSNPVYIYKVTIAPLYICIIINKLM